MGKGGKQAGGNKGGWDDGKGGKKGVQPFGFPRGFGMPPMMPPSLLEPAKGGKPMLVPPQMMMAMMGKGAPMMGKGMPMPMMARPPESMPTPQLTAAALSQVPPAVQKQMIGEKLFKQISKYNPEQAGKITGMMLEMSNAELLMLLESEQRLRAKIDQALEVLASGS